MIMLPSKNVPKLTRVKSLPSFAPIGYTAGIAAGTPVKVTGYGQVEILNFGSNAGGPQDLGFGTRLTGQSALINITDSGVMHSSQNPARSLQGTCFGDSGSAQYINGLIVSVTSTGDAQCRASDKSWRVDTSSAQNFINCVVNAGSVVNARKCGK